MKLHAQTLLVVLFALLTAGALPVASTTAPAQIAQAGFCELFPFWPGC